jgi:hypothetical protein
MNLYFVLALLGAAATAATVLVAVLWKRLRSREQQLLKYAPITDVEREVERARAELHKATQDRDEFIGTDKARRHDLNAKYQEALKTFERLRSEIASLEENLEDISYGLYKPHYNFDTSEEFKRHMDAVYEQKKYMTRNGNAAVCPLDWHVGGDAREGKRMVKQQLKLMLRAFNGEVDAAVAKVSWNNITKMEERIRKAAAAVNESGTVMQATITPEYVEVALKELRLTHEMEQKKYEEKEEQRRIREQMREEEKALREAERAQQEAASEEARFERALAKARSEVEKSKGAALDAANAKLAELEQKLAEAHEKMERAKSMAQLTKSGHVYVISNLGSFGEQTFKIGMTRRLDPQDRVAELSDASVPFDFDVHAMIHSDDAPALEAAFHREFGSRRMNLVNMRKEFFNVTLDDIEVFARTQNLTVEFTKLAEARDYRQTLALRQAANGATKAANGGSGPEFPQPVAAAPPNGGEAFPTELLVE